MLDDVIVLNWYQIPLGTSPLSLHPSTSISGRPIEPWLVQLTSCWFNLSSAPRPLARPSVSALRAMSSKRRAPVAANVRGQPTQKFVTRLVAEQQLVEQQPNLPKHRPNSRVWQREDTTCLSLGLDPKLPAHQPVICNKCTRFWETNLKYGANKYTERSTSQRYLCERPFAYDGGYSDKILTCDWIRELVSGDAVSDDTKIK